MVVSLPTFARLAGKSVTTMDEIPMGAFYVKMATGTDDDDDVNTVKAILGDIATNSTHSLYVYDYRKSLATIDKANIAIEFFFGFTIIVAIVEHIHSPIE